MTDRLTQLEQKFDNLVRVVADESAKATRRYEALEAVFVHATAALMIHAEIDVETVAKLRGDLRSRAASATFPELGVEESMYVAGELEALVDRTMARLEELVTLHRARASALSSSDKSPPAHGRGPVKRKSRD